MREELHVDFDGQTYKVAYSVDRGLITVWAAANSKSTQIGGSPPEGIARIIGKELLEDAKSKGLL